MSYSFGKGIVTDGLVFYVDAANGSSYPGSGTTWTDLIAGVNGSLINGPTYSSSNGGLVITDGSNDVVNFDSFASSFPVSEGTVCVFVKLTNLSGDADLIASLRYSSSNNMEIYQYSGTIRFKYKAGGTTKEISISTSSFSTSSFYMLTLTFSSSGDKVEAYVDGVSQGSATSLGTWSGTPVDWGFGANTSTSSNNQAMQLSSSRVYNRALSSSEILQNYNALKNRFV